MSNKTYFAGSEHESPKMRDMVLIEYWITADGLNGPDTILEVFAEWTDEELHQQMVTDGWIDPDDPDEITRDEALEIFAYFRPKTRQYWEEY